VSAAGHWLKRLGARPYHSKRLALPQAREGAIMSQMMSPRDAEQVLRDHGHSIGPVLDSVDDEAEPGSRSWHMIRAGACAACAEGATDEAEARMLALMAFGYLIASEIQAPDPHPLILQAAAERGLVIGLAGMRYQHPTVGQILAAAARQYGAVADDEPMSPDFGYNYPPVPAQRRWVPQRTAEATSATQDGAGKPRSKGMRKVRIAQEARARARLRAVSRFRKRRGT
jgi:hypothetical protein